MPGRGPLFRFSATGIGSVPFTDVGGTCREILSLLPEAPYWPQFVRRNALETMGLQFTEGLSFLKINASSDSVAVVPPADRAAGLADFYEHHLAGDTEHFRMSDPFAPGLFALLELLDRKAADPALYVKGQTVGPITFAAGLRDEHGLALLYHPDLLDAIVHGLSMKALWQVRELERSGRRPLIFIDEPYLAGYGSAFVPLERRRIVEVLREAIQPLREGSNALVGIHCCGNTDWSMILEARPDIVSFDAYGYMEHFLMYREEIVDFLAGGGAIAWGIVPTTDLREGETPETLLQRMILGIGSMERWGLDRELISERSLLTPSCGMGTLTPETASRVLHLLSQLTGKVRRSFSVPGAPP